MNSTETSNIPYNFVYVYNSSLRTVLIIIFIYLLLCKYCNESNQCMWPCSLFYMLVHQTANLRESYHHHRYTRLQKLLEYWEVSVVQSLRVLLATCIHDCMTIMTFNTIWNHTKLHFSERGVIIKTDTYTYSTSLIFAKWIAWLS